MYLMIQNPGVAPIEAFTVLGLSLSRESTESGGGTIGRFGSGLKHSILMMLRKRINIAVYPGAGKLAFRTESSVVSDGITSKVCNLVQCDVSGRIDGKQVRKTLPLNWDVSYGAFDWNDVWMALREFICNAIDRTYREFSTYRHDELRIEIVEDNQMRAKDGTTRIFLELTDEVSEAYNLVHSRILHLTRPTAVSTLRMIRTTEPGGPTIYKDGIYVRKADSTYDALRSYNCGTELEIDESRNVNDGAIRDAVSRMWASASEETLTQLFREMRDKPDCWEAHSLCTWRATHNANLENWKAAFKKAFGENGVVATSSAHYRQLLESKGYNVVALNETMTKIFRSNGCKTTFDALSADERDGREILPPTVHAETAVKNAWNWFAASGVVPANLSPPTVKCFREVIQKENKTFGFIGADRIVYLNKDFADGLTTDLQRTAVEEVAHHISNANDYSRDFQEFMVSAFVGVCK